MASKIPDFEAAFNRITKLKPGALLEGAEPSGQDPQIYKDEEIEARFYVFRKPAAIEIDCGPIVDFSAELRGPELGLGPADSYSIRVDFAGEAELYDKVVLAAAAAVGERLGKVVRTDRYNKSRADIEFEDPFSAAVHRLALSVEGNKETGTRITLVFPTEDGNGRFEKYLGFISAGDAAAFAEAVYSACLAGQTA